LVLVAGASQIGVGVGHAALAELVPSTRAIAGEIVMLNAGSTLVFFVGTIGATPSLVNVGGVCLGGGLIMLARTPPGPVHEQWLQRTFVGLIARLLVSVRIGLTLSWTRA
jgi:hypothetical protein